MNCQAFVVISRLCKQLFKLIDHQQQSIGIRLFTDFTGKIMQAFFIGLQTLNNLFLPAVAPDYFHAVHGAEQRPIPLMAVLWELRLRIENRCSRIRDPRAFNSGRSPACTTDDFPSPRSADDCKKTVLFEIVGELLHLALTAEKETRVLLAKKLPGRGKDR